MELDKLNAEWTAIRDKFHALINERKELSSKLIDIAQKADFTKMEECITNIEKHSDKITETYQQMMALYAKGYDAGFRLDKEDKIWT